MPDITSVLEIDVKDEAFKQLQKDLQDFRETMQGLKGDAFGGGKALVPGGGGKGGREHVVMMESYNNALKDMVKNTTALSWQFAKFAAPQVWEGAKKLTGAFAKLTKSIISIGGVVSGVLGMVTIAGILKSSQTVMQRAYTGSGLGMNPNDIPRLQQTYGQIFDVGAVSESLATEREKPGSLLMTRLGLSPDQARNASMVELLQKYVKVLQELAAMPAGATADALAAYGMPSSPLDVARVRNLGPGKIREIEEQERKAREASRLREPGAWQQFGAAAGLSRLSIEAGVMNALTPILDPLKELFSILASRLGDVHGGFSWAVKEAAGYLKKFNKGLETGKWEEFFAKIEADWLKFRNLFKSDVKEKSIFERLKEWIESLFKNVADSILKSFEAPLKLFSSVMTDAKNALVQFSNSTAAGILGILPIKDAGAQPITPEPAPSNGGAAPKEPPKNGGMSRPDSGAIPSGEPTFSPANLKIPGSQFYPLMKKYGEKYGIDPNLLYAIAKAESSFNPDIISGKIKSSKRAAGLMQFMPNTAKRFNIDPLDPEQAIAGAGRYFRDLFGMFGGNEDYSIASYNAGEYNVQKAIKRAKERGGNWKDYLPKQETRDYLDKVKRYRKDMERVPVDKIAAIPMDRNIKVSIYNKSSNSDVTLQAARQARQWV